MHVRVQFYTNFWSEARAEYPVILKAVLRVLIPMLLFTRARLVFLLWQFKKQNIARNWMLKGKCALRFQTLPHDLRRFAET